MAIWTLDSKIFQWVNHHTFEFGRSRCITLLAWPSEAEGAAGRAPVRVPVH